MHLGTMQWLAGVLYYCLSLYTHRHHWTFYYSVAILEGLALGVSSLTETMNDWSNIDSGCVAKRHLFLSHQVKAQGMHCVCSAAGFVLISTVFTGTTSASLSPFYNTFNKREKRQI